MPALKNPKHEAFAQKVALGSSAAEAYRQGWDCTAESAETHGPRLARSGQVSVRIDELRNKVAATVEKKFDMTKEKWLERLATIAGKAEDAEDFSAATGALTQIGKAAAYYAPEEIKHSGSIGLEVLSEAVAKVFGK